MFNDVLGCIDIRGLCIFWEAFHDVEAWCTAFGVFGYEVHIFWAARRHNLGSIATNRMEGERRGWK